MSQTIKSQARLSKTPEDNSGLRNLLHKISTFLINATKKFFKGLMIFIMVISCITILYKLGMRQEIIHYFGEQPIMNTKLLGLKLHSRSFMPRKGIFNTRRPGSKPGSNMMSNYFYTPEDKTREELLYEIVHKAEEYGWEFNYNSIAKEIQEPYKEEDSYYVSSLEKNKFRLSILVEKRNYSPLIFVTIMDSMPW